MNYGFFALGCQTTPRRSRCKIDGSMSQISVLNYRTSSLSQLPALHVQYLRLPRTRTRTRTAKFQDLVHPSHSDMNGKPIVNLKSTSVQFPIQLGSTFASTRIHLGSNSDSHSPSRSASASNTVRTARSLAILHSQLYSRFALTTLLYPQSAIHPPQKTPGNPIPLSSALTFRLRSPPVPHRSPLPPFRTGLRSEVSSVPQFRPETRLDSIRDEWTHAIRRESESTPARLDSTRFGADSERRGDSERLAAARARADSTQERATTGFGTDDLAAAVEIRHGRWRGGFRARGVGLGTGQQRRRGSLQTADGGDACCGADGVWMVGMRRVAHAMQREVGRVGAGLAEAEVEVADETRCSVWGRGRRGVVEDGARAKHAHRRACSALLPRQSDSIQSARECASVRFHACERDSARSDAEQDAATSRLEGTDAAQRSDPAFSLTSPVHSTPPQRCDPSGHGHTRSEYPPRVRAAHAQRAANASACLGARRAEARDSAGTGGRKTDGGGVDIDNTNEQNAGHAPESRKSYCAVLSMLCQERGGESERVRDTQKRRGERARKSPQRVERRLNSV
ncbi:hypothetical protein C8R43DRAFT_963310 [Mycena crocata]|nr:hypothetical protein C8R43DRAFT_963310 [Mycena crocata]